jgi:hypothetical protein
VTPPESQEADVPLLTEVVEEASDEALALELEGALLERLRPEIDRVSAEALERMRAELTRSVLQMVREAVSASLARVRRGSGRH